MKNLPLFPKTKRQWLAATALLIFAALACGLPSSIQSISPLDDEVAAPRPTITPTPQPLPPELIEVDPAPGSRLALDSALTLYFNQAMQRASVEAALSVKFTLADGQVMAHNVEFTWLDDSTLIVVPTTGWLPDIDWQVLLGTSAVAANGLSMSEALNLAYRTAPPLEITQTLPEAGASDVDPSSALVVSFNQPVVALGADPAALPQALNIEPAIAGHGEWVNTSTYIYYPDTALYGGTNYSVSLNANLQATSGVSLAAGEQWNFNTASPALVSALPQAGSNTLPLDTSLTLAFNQSMDPASVEMNFSLISPAGQPIPGTFEWGENDREMVFAPAELLARNATYTFQLAGQAQALGGTPLGNGFSSTFSTVGGLVITSTNPQPGGVSDIHEGVTLNLSSFVSSDEDVDLLEYISITPEVSDLYYWAGYEGREINLNGNFEPLTQYQITISADLPDIWGGTLGFDYPLSFQTSALKPSLNFSQYANYLYLTPRETGLAAQVTNLSGVDIFMGPVPYADFINFLSPGGYEIVNNYYPLNAQSWTHEFNLPGDRIYKVQLPVQPDGSGLTPGLYHFNLSSAEMQYTPGPYVLVCSNVHLTLKLSATQAFVWAIDLRTNAPVAGETVIVYGPENTQLAVGVTDENGIFQSDIPPQKSLYDIYYAIMGQPGQDNFALSLNEWRQGIESYDFGISSDFVGPQTEAYLYTDRPIYRPGQTVSYKAILREAYNGRYTPAGLESVPITIFDQNNNIVVEENLIPSAFGTVHGQYSLSESAQPGTYQINTPFGSIWFDVAEYRKPEINLQVSTLDDIEDTLADRILTAQVEARYFFDAPAGDIDLRWELFKKPAFFSLPGYRVGEENYRWMYPFWMGGYYGQLVDSGEGRTTSQGLLDLELEIAPEEAMQVYSLEVTMTDESGFPVSARTEFRVHPAENYIGVRPDTWLGQAGNEISFEVLSVDWDAEAAPDLNLKAVFQEITWVREAADDPYMPPEIVPQYRQISNAEFRTGPDGVARLAFTPPEAGTYQLEIQGPGAAATQTLLWVGGQGQAVWPNLPNQRLRLTADKPGYDPGETAEIFIPNPLGAGTQALVTVERGFVTRHFTLNLAESGYTLSLPLSDDDAPNIYVSATLIGPGESGNIDFRQGYLNLPVEPRAQVLNVEVLAVSNGRDVTCNVSTNCPEHLEPRQDVTFDLRVTDADGNPVQGEFSLAVADLAALALADPNSIDILSAFYSEQPMGVSTSLALTMHVQRQLFIPGGMGGGGGDGEIPFVREQFPDTAYWNAEIMTDDNGEAQATFSLPDSLTTWHVDIRGLTMDTRVGQAETHIVTSRDLLVRPVTPRFFVAGDHVRISAVVHNNSATDLQVDVALQSAGFILDDLATELQEFNVAAGSRQQVIWWGTAAADADVVTMIFSASGQNAAGNVFYQDITKPVWGDIPVASYSTPQTYGTAGVLDESGERLELVSLPQSFDPAAGELALELAPSLAAAMTAGLDVLEHYPYECTEQTLSRFLPNLEAYRAIQSLGLDAPDLQARLDRTLNVGLDRLIANQNMDGGWSWWPAPASQQYFGEEEHSVISDPYITAYVLFGLSRTKAAGVFVDDAVIQNASNFLLTTMASLWGDLETWRLDRIAFMQYVVAQARGLERLGMDANELYQYRDRLSPWAKAMLAMTFETLAPGDERAGTLLSDLNATAIRSATGTHWEGGDSWRNMETGVFNSAVVIYALAQQDPASSTLPEAVRYLMDHRDARGAWASTYETAWTLLALTEVMKGTGELAGDYAFSADVNGTQMAQGQAGGDMRLNAVSSAVPLAQLYAEYPNALHIKREAGPGRLYYTAHLNVLSPVENVTPLNAGIGVERAYYPLEAEAVSGQSSETNPGEGVALESAAVGETLQVHLTLTLDSEAYYLAVEDYIPAGAEVLNANLKTSQQTLQYDVRDPFGDGWGWWYFSDPQIYDDHIAWAVDYLPAGTYELTYLLVLNQPGQYRVIPARAWQFYFPEVQGNSAGTLFEIVE
jgi:alpha-2-macroglobulin